MTHPATVKNQQANAEVAKSGSVSTGKEVSQTPEFDEFLKDQAAIGGDTGLDPYEAILRQVLNAESPDAVLTPTEVAQGTDLLDVPLALLGFRLNESEYDVGSPFYATMEVIDMRTNDGMVVNTGHKKVLAQLVRLQQLNDGPNEDYHFPFAVMFIQRGMSKVNTPMLELRKWEDADTQKEAPF
jgi:hypothetical protein